MHERETHNPYEAFSPIERQNELRMLIEQLPPLPFEIPSEENKERKSTRGTMLEEANDSLKQYRERKEHLDRSEHRIILVDAFSNLIDFSETSRGFKNENKLKYNKRYYGSSMHFVIEKMGRKKRDEVFPGYLAEYDDPTSEGIFNKKIAKRIERSRYWEDFLHDRWFRAQLKPSELELLIEIDKKPNSTKNQFLAWESEFYRHYGEEV